MSFLLYRNGVGGSMLSSTSPDGTNGTVAEHGSELSTLFRRYEQCQEHDLQKNRLVDELLTRIEYLTQQNQTMNAELQSNKKFVESWQNERVQYKKYFDNLNRALTETPFVMVLIDGDGMIFTEEFLQQGELGGRRAASQLYSAVQTYIEEGTNDIPLGTRIVCRMYANAKGLADVLVRAGIIQEIGIFEDFVRGFSRGKILFDFVDVGSGKDRADEKIIESLKLFSQNYQCRRVLFGCSHDNGYARSLEEYSDRAEITSKVILLEGVPFEKELVELPYDSKKFPGLFRETKLVVSPPTGPKNYSIFSGLPTRFPAPSRPAGPMDSPLPSRAALESSSMPRTASSSTLASDGVPPPKPVTSWAMKAAAPPPPASAAVTLPASKSVNREEEILRNRAGQRVDPPSRHFDKTEVDRIKKMKLCNVHFLRKECPYSLGCTHDHTAKLNKDELSTLRLVARMAPCVHSSGCQDAKCIYGHRCPAPPHRTNHVKGTKSCIFGEGCKFPPELHDIDCAVVKTLVVR